MDYMTFKEVSKKWDVSFRQINYHYADGRISGVVKMVDVWLLPKEADKLADRRYKESRCANATHSNL